MPRQISRLVDENFDYWCRYTHTYTSSIPFGYVIIIKEIKDGMHIDVPGFIVRSKLIQKKLHLQVVMIPDKPIENHYLITVESRNCKRRKGGKKHKTDFINIKNMNKRC